MPTADQWLGVLRKYKGVTENPRGSNRQPFAAMAGHPNGNAWCATFVVACAREAGVKLPSESSYTPTMADGFRRTGTWFTSNPKPGDVCFFDFPDSVTRIQHVGVVRGISGDNILTVEGNGLPLETPVLTPTGWQPIGGLAAGASICDPQGDASIILSTYPQGRRPCTMLHLSDGRSIVADDQHRWKVGIGRGQQVRWTVLTTTEVAAWLAESSQSLRLPPVLPLEFASVTPLEVDPWLLGVLLGDGSFVRPDALVISCGEPAFAQRILDALPNHDIKVYRRDYSSYGDQYDEGVSHVIQGSIVSWLERQGLWGKQSPEKWIPPAYLWSSVKDRLALLQGLMDTDGHVDKLGRAEFTTTSLQLARDVAHLVRSLGGITHLTHAATSYRRITDEPDIRREGRRAYDLKNIRFSTPIIPVTRDHKAARWRSPSWTRPVRIVATEPCGEEETVCISVSAVSCLYLAGDFIPTHNTSSGNTGSQDNGGGVFERVRPPKYIVGYGRPSFDNAVIKTLGKASDREAEMEVVVQRAQGGYIVVGNDGGVFAYDGAPFKGSIPGMTPRPTLGGNMVGGAWTASGNGYWLVASDGAVYAFGDAQWKGGFNQESATIRGRRYAVGIVRVDRPDGQHVYQVVTRDPSNDGTPFDVFGYPK